MSLDSYEHDDEEEDSWEYKYQIADAQLQKFRTQAAKVRELLAKKMRVYEEKISDIEDQRDGALDKVERLEIAVQNKDENISALRETISNMRDEKVRENATWEERETTMKDWIKVKFTDMLKELEQVRKEKKELEAKFKPQKKELIKGSVQRKSIGAEDPNIYEEVFSKILVDLQKPHYENVNSRPSSPELPPPTPERQPNRKIRDHVHGNKDHAHSNRDHVHGNSGSQKPVLRRIAKFFNIDSSASSSPSPSSCGSKKSPSPTPTPPPPIPRKIQSNVRKNSRIMITTIPELPVPPRPRRSHDVILSQSPRPMLKSLKSDLIWNKVNTDSNENEVNSKLDSSDSRTEPFYFTLVKETYSEIESKEGEHENEERLVVPSVPRLTSHERPYRS